MKRPPKQAGKPEGFTLVEMIAVIVVMAIILPAVFLPYIEASRQMEKPVILGTMALLAQGEMEKKVIAFNYHSVTAWAEGDIPGFSGYQSSCEIDEDAEFGPVTDGVKLVTVTVSHGGYSLNLVTVKAAWE